MKFIMKKFLLSIAFLACIPFYAFAGEPLVCDGMAAIAAPALPKDWSRSLSERRKAQVCHALKMVQTPEGEREFLDQQRGVWKYEIDALMVLAKFQAMTPEGRERMPETLLELSKLMPVFEGGAFREYHRFLDNETLHQMAYLEYMAFGDRAPLEVLKSKQFSFMLGGQVICVTILLAYIFWVFILIKSSEPGERGAGIMCSFPVFLCQFFYLLLFFSTMGLLCILSGPIVRTIKLNGFFKVCTRKKPSRCP